MMNSTKISPFIAAALAMSAIPLVPARSPDEEFADILIEGGPKFYPTFYPKRRAHKPAEPFVPSPPAKKFKHNRRG